MSRVMRALLIALLATIVCQHQARKGDGAVSFKKTAHRLLRRGEVPRWSQARASATNAVIADIAGERQQDAARGDKLYEHRAADTDC